LETSAKTLPQLESDIKSKINFEEDTKLVLEFRKNEQLFILDDIKNLEDGMAIKILIKTRERELLDACQKGHIETVKLLLTDERVDVNVQDKHERTPFYIACENGHIEIAELLLNEKRLSIRKKTNKGETALDIAKTNNHSEIMKLIKEVDTGNLLNDY